MRRRTTEKPDVNRRAFIGAVATVGAGAVLASCKKSYPPVTFVDSAPDGPVLKAGLIGCGERGTGAALNFLKAGPNLKLVALGDVLPDRLEASRQNLAKKAQVQVADDHCFIGFDAYKKVLDSDVDVVLLTTPPHFRPPAFRCRDGGQETLLSGEALRGGCPRSALGPGDRAESRSL